MDVVGYADRFSVQPGETIEFMVSSHSLRYQARVVQLFHGDANPDGPGYKDQAIETPIEGEYWGRYQRIRAGSHILIAESPHLRLMDSLTIQLWMMPTLPTLGRQGVLTNISTDGGQYGLFIAEDGRLEFRVSSDRGTEGVVRSTRALRASAWYFVGARLNVTTELMDLRVEPVRNWAVQDAATITHPELASSRINTCASAPVVCSSLLIAGAWNEDGGGHVGFHYDGKIDSPRLYSRRLSDEELVRLRNGGAPRDIPGLVGSWDFSKEISSRRVVDVSGNGLHGKTVNMPTRGVTGRNWRGLDTNFGSVRDEYGAIHFHHDDLDDAGWDTDIKLTVPNEFASGVYALHLRGDTGEDYVPFFVRPRRGTTTARILMLAPTFSYLAYANEQLLNNTDVRRSLEDLGVAVKYPSQAQDRYIVEHDLLSCYDTHADGSGVCYSSRLRPILNMRPKYTSVPGFPHQFNADLHLVDWLRVHGYDFDVATDEDLHHEGVDLLRRYNVVLSGTHHEYWSLEMLKGLESYLDGGGRFMCMSGNGLYWVTQLDAEHAHTIEVRRWGAATRTWDAAPGEWHLSTTGELGGLWRFRGRAPQRVIGVGFTAQGMDRGRPYARAEGSFDQRAAFIFRGISDELIGDFPSLVSGWGAAGAEIDRVDERLGSPPHTLVLATATGFSDAYHHAIDDALMSTSSQVGSISPLVRADMAYTEYPNGGAVFATGSIAWCACLSYRDYDNNVSRITANVLERFADNSPLGVHPSDCC